MDICKVYRGLDSPCKIKGLLSHYFYIVFCAYLVSFVFVLFSFSSILQKGTVLPFLWKQSLNWEFRQLFTCISIGNPTK